MLIKAYEGEHIEDFAKKVIQKQQEDITKVITADFNDFIINVTPKTTINIFIADYNRQWEIAFEKGKYFQK